MGAQSPSGVLRADVGGWLLGPRECGSRPVESGGVGRRHSAGGCRPL